MEEKMQKLKEFISKYGQDFLEDGTKAKFLKKIDSNDKEFMLEMLNTMDEDWLKRAKELEMFLIFTDREFTNDSGKKFQKPYLKANYIDSQNLQQKNIPVLRNVERRYLSLDLDNRFER